MKTFLVALVITLAASQAYAQEKLTQEMIPDIEWGEGSIMLNNGTEIKGMVRYNDRSGLVSFENGNDNRSFTARSILGFEFFDEKLQRQRIFYSLEYAFEDEPSLRPYLFEVLKDLKDFVVLSRMDPVEVKQRVKTGTPIYNSSFYIGTTGSITTTVNQTETVYIMNASGEIKPYMKVLRKVVDRELFDRKVKRTRVIDKNLLKEYFVDPGYSEMIKYAEEHNLDLEDKEDFIKVLEYYKEVMGG